MPNIENNEYTGVWIPRAIYEDKNINALEKMILVEIDHLAKQKLGCVASNKHFADHCGCSERTVSRAISKLEELGYISSRVYDGKNRKIDSYVSRIVSERDYPSQNGDHRQNGDRMVDKMATDPRQNGDIVIPISNTSSSYEEDNRAMDKKTTKKANMQLATQTYALGETELEQALNHYIDYRLTKDGKAFTEHALNLALKKLDTLTQSPSEKIAIIEQTICNGWSGLFPIDRNKQQTHPTAPREFIPIPEHKDWDI